MADKESKIVKRRPAIADARDPYCCVWLQEMAEKGLFYKGRSLFSARFEVGTPQKRRYRAVEKGFFGLKKDELELYESAGWNMVQSWGDATIFTTDDESAPEIYSDADSYIRSVKRKSILSVIVVIAGIYIVIQNIINSGSLIRDKGYADHFGRIHGLADSPLGFNVSILLFAVLMTVLWIYLISREVKIIRIYRGSLEKAYDISYDDPNYLKAKKMNWIPELAAIILLLSFIPMLIGLGGVKFDEKALNYNGEHPVMLKEIYPELWNKYEPYVSRMGEEQKQIELSYMAGQDSADIIFKKNWTESVDVIKNGSPETDDYEVLMGYDAVYKIARSEKKAEEYLGEEIAYDKYAKVENDDIWIDALEDVRIDVPGVDYAGYYETTYGEQKKKLPMSYLYLRKGPAIQIISSIGPIDIKDKIDIFVKEFEEE